MDAGVKSSALAGEVQERMLEEQLAEGLKPQKTDGLYAKYVLFVLFLVCVLNFLDRQILTVLAEDIKADLGLTDAKMGFLAGAAFAVFYATFGITLGRLADVWSRKKLISIGLGFWSLMTVLSGLTRSFVPLAACRFGVGAGEASAIPSGYSLLYDYFSPKVRTTVLALYASGVIVGGGLGIFLGGQILEAWKTAWPDSSLAPFGLAGWQAAFMTVGLPGLLIAFWVATLREPMRGLSDGIASKPHGNPFGEAATVMMSVLPVTNIIVMVREKAPKDIIVYNLILALLIVVGGYALSVATGDVMQWAALSFGIYAAVSWAQCLSVRDPVVFGMIFRCKSMLYLIIGAALFVFSAATSFWIIPFFQRYHGVSAAEVGNVLGIGHIVLGCTGIILGGVLADKLRHFTPKGKIYVCLVAYAISMCSGISVLLVDDLHIAYGAELFAYFVGPMTIGPMVSTVNDLVLPRGRATSSSAFTMVQTLFGFALAPYVVGFISDSLAATGVDEGVALQQGILWPKLIIGLLGLLFMMLVMRHLEADEAGLKERARALGEEI